MNKIRMLSIIKLILGLTLLALVLLWDDNAQKLWRLMHDIDLAWVAALFMFGMALNLVSCLKWRIFIKERGFHVSIARLFGLYLVGKFFSNFMPSMIGGDITRSYLLGREINSQSQSFASVFLERFTGLVALIVMALLFSLFNPDLLREPKIGVAIASITILFAIGISLLLKQEIAVWAEEKLRFIPGVGRIASTVSQIQIDIIYFKRKYRLLSAAMAYSFAFHFMTSVLVYMSCLSMGLSPSFLDIAVITPIILLLNTIPVSPNNIGWWEWSFSFLLVEAGTGTAEGLAVGLVIRAVTLAYSFIGGALFLFEKTSKPQSAPDCR